ncbi:MAG TPA: DUF167 domain-containing protein, partial [Acidimicrobiales bacterium]|nr:DUF167 domain-containing protein [Acidimicrobiales bacterium]
MHRRFAVRVIPGAHKTVVGGHRATSEGDILVVRVQAPAVDGKANEAAVEALARALGVRPGAVRIVGGARRRTKVVEVDGVDADVLQRLERYVPL